jgi:FkbM family methyltransferase
VMRQTLLNFARRQLGLKNLADYVESRGAMLGVGNLPIGTVIDVGANRGRHTRRFRRRFPDAQILAIEPVPALHRELAAWACGHAESVQTFNVALSHEQGAATFYVHRRSSIWSTLKPPAGDEAGDYEPISVAVETLDNLVAPLELDDEILIKIDAEGCDLDVIRGGRATLERSAAVVVEASFFPTRYGDEAPVFEEILTELSALGFCYRGNVRCGWDRGVCVAADALFVHRRIAGLLAG